MLSDFELLGAFYLGRVDQDPYLYDSRDLLTHAVVIGMTGSGKTGLSIALLEEAAIDGVPAIAIDPKGDLTNLLLTFPDLRPDDFAPWVAPDKVASEQAEAFGRDLAQWGQDASRIRHLREAADITLYTPGSRAAIPVSAFDSLQPPAPAILDDPELVAERASAVATSLLGLVSIEADPLRSREHVFLANLLQSTWLQRKSIDLAALIQLIQEPGIDKVGVLPLESFFPRRDRFELAAGFNNLLASPSFASWLDGEPMDIDDFLHSPQGKPKISIFSIAHLGDAERMFFVSMLLHRVVGWMRGQSGTTSLRAILYMDEIAGYFPPVANPASKQPLITLLKQARAYGLGVVLATQNPVDLDYKGLSNAGTWFLGRLQTERDKARVMDGLEGASSGKSFDRKALETTLSGLEPRQFLVHNIHADEPLIIQSRSTLSYLRGPLTRDQIRQLSAMARRNAPQAPSAPAVPQQPLSPASTPQAFVAQPQPPPQASPPQFATPPMAPQVPVAPAVALAGASLAAAAVAPAMMTPTATPSAIAPSPPGPPQRPMLPPDIQQVFLPTNMPHATYLPYILVAARVRFHDSRNNVDVSHDVMFITPIGEGPVPVQWEQAVWAYARLNDLTMQPPPGASFAPLPQAAATSRNYSTWSRSFVSWVAQNHAITVLRSPTFKITSQPGEHEGAFRGRLMHAAREARDKTVEDFRKKYASKFQSLEERIRRAQHTVSREHDQASGQKLDGAVSVGTGIIGSFLGRGVSGRGLVYSAGSAARYAGRVSRQQHEIQREQENLEVLYGKWRALEQEFQTELAAAVQKYDPAQIPLEQVTIKPGRSDIEVQLIALGWKAG